jgi:hypothetical protein
MTPEDGSACFGHVAGLRISGSACGPKNVRIGREERGGTEGEALTRLDGEPGLLYPGGCVSRQVTSTGEVWPEGRVGESLNACLPLGVADNVLIEAQFAPWPDDSEQLGESALLVGNGAEDERGYASVESPLIARQPMRVAV